MKEKQVINRYFLSALLCILLHPFLASGQIQEYIVAHTSPINSVEFNDTSYNDLIPLSRAIGDKRVVMLGELFHGDGETMKLKSRLIRFLHERMGFNVLVFESDFFSLNEGYNAFRQHKISFDSLLYLSVFPTWTQCQQMHELFQYLRESTSGKQELIISGMDNRGISGYSLRYLKGAVDAFLRKSGIPFVHDSVYRYFHSMLGKSYSLVYGKNRPGLDSMIKLLPVVINQLSENSPALEDLETGFYLNVLKGLLINYKLSLYYYYNSAEYKRDRKDHPLHDSQLAENLKWLVTRKFPNEKIVVWAHNTHIEKGPFENLSYRGYNSMGYLFTQDKQVLSQTYIIGLTCYEGEGQLTLRDVREKVSLPHKKSIESWIHAKGFRYAFADITSAPAGNKTNSRFYMKDYINTESRQIWTAFFDGILYINRAQPCIKQDLIKK
ncbi:erythromycin esterase family protein [Chitinophaga sp. CF418]|uniref:erythromycin esterase family protein n=1 Tax=Chitinophaga sp. CF418 TaxID=1855287 RepID=UPI00090EBECE|nr:erythromycin esterase family protein [Chitinophaga sp. CF418]SHN34431.1 Erythromycin esterase homolog [Chitinophaga sp. CF418]